VGCESCRIFDRRLLLLFKLKKRIGCIVQVEEFKDLERFETIVFNYPEKKITAREVARIKRWLRSGKRTVFTSYYGDMDSTGSNINAVLERIGCSIRVNGDVVVDEERNYNGDKLFPTARFLDVGEVVMPCTSSLSVGEAAKVVVAAHNTARARSRVIVAEERVSNGEVVVSGTCVFWDNYSIDLGKNFELAKYLLCGKRINHGNGEREKDKAGV
jgi:hypothetical protein